MDYRYEGKLFGVGVVDIASDALSSVLLCILIRIFSKYSPGIFSMLIEIETAVKLDKKYYYPGYYIYGNRSMEYKAKFKPHERLNWETMQWEIQDDTEPGSK